MAPSAFKNGANDSDEQKKRIRAKFTSDLAAAVNAKSDLKVFAFLTNVHFTMGEQSGDEGGGAKGRDRALRHSRP